MGWILLILLLASPFLVAVLLIRLAVYTLMGLIQVTVWILEWWEDR